MRLYNIGHTFRYETEHVAALFFPEQKMQVFEGEPPDDGAFATTSLQNGLLTASFWDGVKRLTRSYPATGEAWRDERLLCRALYEVLAEATGILPPWGTLTGVRPVKFARQAMARGEGYEQFRRYYEEECLVSEGKLALAWRTAETQRNLVLNEAERAVSVYLSVPFCPSRCSYCSFVSQPTPRILGMIDDYVDKLCEEIQVTAALAKTHRLSVETVYVGGGTPTTLSASQMRRVTDTLRQTLPMDEVKEFTVEAGRPDTITEEKLRGLKDAGVTRVSINPQTLSDEVLSLIGRRHTADEAVRAYHLAREIGFRAINMDLIAGLPGDSFLGYQASLEGVIALAPENITVHTLSIKRSSDLGGASRREVMAGIGEVSRMLSYTERRMNEEGYNPYYLYRQKNTMGNTENVGYAKPGTEGLYNILMMDEIHSILSAGAGAVTKLVGPDGEDIRRVFNYKYPGEYLSGFHNILDRKGKVGAYYDQVWKT